MKIVVFVDGGNIQEIFTNAQSIAEVDIIDFDNLKAEGKSSKERYAILREAQKNLTQIY